MYARGAEKCRNLHVLRVLVAGSEAAFEVFRPVADRRKQKGSDPSADSVFDAP